MQNREGHLERDALEYVREKRLKAEHNARNKVAKEIGLLPDFESDPEEVPPTLTTSPSRSSARYQGNMGVSGRVRMILYALGLALTLFLLFFMNQGVIPEKIVINKQTTETVIVNQTIIEERIIKPDPEIIEREVIIEEDVPTLEHRGNLWCNGKGMCYPV